MFNGEYWAGYILGYGFSTPAVKGFLSHAYVICEIPCQFALYFPHVMPLCCAFEAVWLWSFSTTDSICWTSLPPCQINWDIGCRGDYKPRFDWLPILTNPNMLFLKLGKLICHSCRRCSCQNAWALLEGMEIFTDNSFEAVMCKRLS